jgi:RNA polymerase sigma factor (sigma-70 family)
MIRRTADDRFLSALTDQELLRRFSSERDQTAFHGLLRRHGPMVLDVCRSVLRNQADAEDAFQATFLVLSQRAETIREKASVGSWLYGVAYRTALKAQAQSARRQKKEAVAPGQPRRQGPDDLTWREAQQSLHAELSSLAERYRAPLVLCYLQGRTQEEAATLLGVSKAALRKHLERGRALLRQRLVRRGLGPLAVLMAAAWPAAGASGGLPLALSASDINTVTEVVAGGAGASVVSARVAALAEGVTRAMFMTKVKIATMAFLLALVGLGAGAMMNQIAATEARAKEEPAQRPAEAEVPTAAVLLSEAPTAPAKDVPTTGGEKADIEVRGRVFGPDGKPFAGAKLYVNDAGKTARKDPVRVTSGDDGRFKFTLEKADDSPRQVMAVADGHGCDWAPIGQEELTLRLVKDVPINGRILDPDGKPVVGAKLSVTSVSAPNAGLESYLDAFRKGEGDASAKDWNAPLPGQPAVTTGDDGRFRLAGAGRERIVHLRLEGPAIASTTLNVMTRKAETVAGGSPQRGWWRFHGAASDYVAHASRPIRGVVRDKETGKPLAGVTVAHYHGQGPETITDKDGRYELLGLHKTARYALDVKPPDGLYFRQRLHLQDTPGLGALTGDVSLTQGLTVRGRITDKATGKPVAQAHVEYHPLAGNTYANQMADVSKPCAATTTDAEGSYSLTVLPGQGVIGVAAPRLDAHMPAVVTLKELKDFFKAPVIEQRESDSLTLAGGANSFASISQHLYNALVLLEPGEKERGLVKNVALEAPLLRKGRVVGLEDQPLAGVDVIGLDPSRSNAETLKGAEFTVRGVNPRAQRPLVFYHKDKDLGFFVKDLGGDTSELLTVKLQPCGSASGRVLDQDGLPVAGLRLFVTGRATRSLSGGRSVTTDKEGRFRALGLVPGQEYRLWCFGKRPSILPLYAPVEVESGKHKDMGDLKMTEQDEEP